MKKIMLSVLGLSLLMAVGCRKNTDLQQPANPPVDPAAIQSVENGGTIPVNDKAALHAWFRKSLEAVGVKNEADIQSYIRLEEKQIAALTARFSAKGGEGTSARVACTVPTTATAEGFQYAPTANLIATSSSAEPGILPPPPVKCNAKSIVYRLVDQLPNNRTSMFVNSASITATKQNRTTMSVMYNGNINSTGYSQSTRLSQIYRVDANGNLSLIQASTGGTSSITFLLNTYSTSDNLVTLVFTSTCRGEITSLNKPGDNIWKTTSTSFNIEDDDDNYNTPL